MTPTYRRFRPADARRIHTQSLSWLDQQLEKARGRKVVVVTHHAPSPQSIPQRFRNDPLNPAFASNLEPFVAARLLERNPPRCRILPRHIHQHGGLHHRFDKGDRKCHGGYAHGGTANRYKPNPAGRRSINFRPHIPLAEQFRRRPAKPQRLVRFQHGIPFPRA